MGRIVSLLTAVVALSACSSPTAPSPEQAAKAKAALATASSQHVSAERSSRLSSN